MDNFVRYFSASTCIESFTGNTTGHRLPINGWWIKHTQWLQQIYNHNRYKCLNRFFAPYRWAQTGHSRMNIKSCSRALLCSHTNARTKHSARYHSCHGVKVQKLEASGRQQGNQRNSEAISRYRWRACAMCQRLRARFQGADFSMVHDSWCMIPIHDSSWEHGSSTAAVRLKSISVHASFCGYFGDTANAISFWLVIFLRIRRNISMIASA